MRKYSVRWSFSLAAVGLLAGCYDLTLTKYGVDSGSGGAGTSPGTVGSGGSGGLGDGGDAGVLDAPGAQPDVPTGGTGGTTATGGTEGSGGTTNSGGTTTPGGTTASGGTSNAGGTTTAGGTTASGGTSSAGGTATAGGTTANGGTTSAGGTTTAGGTIARGGTTNAGGTTTAGGTTSGGTTSAGGTTTAGGTKGTGSGGSGGNTGAGGTSGSAGGGGTTSGSSGILAAETASFHCFNWADAGDNFQTGALVLTGMSASDSYDTVLASSNAIISGFKTVLGATAFRMPINETTVNTATTWAAYKGIFDAAISQNMKVMIAYFLPPGSNHIADMTAWNTMWSTVVAAYGPNDLIYFDVFNEPSGYSATAFITLVQQWMTANPSVPANRVIVAGTTTDIDVNQQGAALPNCLLSLHIYDSVGNTVAAAEAALKTHAGPYYNRTIVTEYVGASLFMQGITTQMKAYGMGSCYWAGLEGTGGVAKLSGTAPNYTLTVNDAATLTVIQSGWSP